MFSKHFILPSSPKFSWRGGKFISSEVNYAISTGYDAVKKEWSN